MGGWAVVGRSTIFFFEKSDFSKSTQNGVKWYGMVGNGAG